MEGELMNEWMARNQKISFAISFAKFTLFDLAVTIFQLYLQDVCLQNDGIQITHESIQLTFPESEVVLKAIIKRRNEIIM